MSIAPKADGQRPKTVYMAKRRQQMGMTIDDAIKKYKNNAEYERTHGNLQGCLEFQQLAGWLKDYKRLLEQEPTTKNDLAVDCISRADALDCVNIGITFCDVYKKINDLPPVTPREPVLNKIRAEILENAFEVVNPYNTYKYINVLDLRSIEKIIDKYKAESEGKE